MIKKEELDKIEYSGDWKSAIQLMKQADKIDPMDPFEMEIYIRVIFILLDFLVEGEYIQEEHDYAARELKLYFDESYSKYHNHAEYLFFLGYIIPIAEWYFGIQDLSVAYEMRKKAMDKEPGNILYKWSYLFIDTESKEAGRFAEKLLKHDISKVVWLRSRGIIGEYIVGMIEYSYKNYETILNK